MTTHQQWPDMPRAERYAAAMAARHEGLSASQTAERHGTTRNAVLGAIKRGPDGTSRSRKPPSTRLPIVRALFDTAAAKGISNTELARVSGYNMQHLSCLRQGHYNPSVATLADLANAVGCELTLMELSK